MRPEYQTGRAFHTTFAMVKNKIVAIGVNDYNTCHPYHLFGHYEDHKNYTDSYDACLHSEVSLLKKLLKIGIDKRVKIINVRIDNTGNANLATPCPNCLKLLNKNDLKNIYFTISENKFGEIKL